MSEPTAAAKAQDAEPAPTPQSRSLALPALLLVQGVFLLLLALGGFFGWQLWQQYRALIEHESQQKTALSALQTQLEGSRLELVALQNALAALPDAREQHAQQQSLLEQLKQSQTALQDEQQQLKARLSDINGSHSWQLNEALYQMQLASLRLSVMQDAGSARSLLKNADELLIAQQDPASLATRKALAEVLQQLEAAARLDRDALYLKLAALRSQASTLSRSLPRFAAAEVAERGTEEQSWWQQWREALSHYVRIDFEASGQDIRPLLAGQSLNEARLALTLNLEQAQWAVLHGQQAVYSQALKQADELLLLAFNPQDSGTQSLQSAISTLQSRVVAPSMPDLAPLLTAMQSYMQKRQQAQNAEATPKTPDIVPEAASEAAP